MRKNLKVGIVGTGKFAGHHANVWRSITGIEVSGSYGTDERRLASFCQKFGLEKYNDYEKLIENSYIIDVVSINNTHCDYAGKAIQRSRHVVIEKPLDIDYKKAKKIYEASLKNKRIVASVVSQFRFMNAFQEIKKILDRSLLGRVHNCRLQLFWPREKDYFEKSSGWMKDKNKAGGGMLIQQSIHFVDILHWLFGEAASVFGRKNSDKDAVERSFWGEIEFKQGTICQLYLTSQVFPYFIQRLELFGDKGVAAVNGSLIFRRISNNTAKDMLKNIASFANRLLKGPENSSVLLRRQFLDIINAVLSQKKPFVTIKDGLTALRTVLELYRSSDSGERIYLKDSDLT